VKIQVPLNQALRLIVPGVVGLVSTEYRGRSNVATISWLAPVSREPPLLAIAVHPSTLSHDMIKRSGEFVVNVPNRDVINQVVSCGRFSGNDFDKFARTGLTMVEPTVVRAPLIEQCIGHLECALVNSYQPGDHTIFIGQVACAWAEEGAFDNGWLLEGAELKPLHHLGAAIFGVLDERIDATPAELKSED
jgi:flavin reductase (DIM6/NTAB) family NADH-FMN oxidoreductase RutF